MKDLSLHPRMIWYKVQKKGRDISMQCACMPACTHTGVLINVHLSHSSPPALTRFKLPFPLGVILQQKQ